RLNTRTASLTRYGSGPGERTPLTAVAKVWHPMSAHDFGVGFASATPDMARKAASTSAVTVTTARRGIDGICTRSCGRELRRFGEDPALKRLAAPLTRCAAPGSLPFSGQILSLLMQL